MSKLSVFIRPRVAWWFIFIMPFFYLASCERAVSGQSVDLIPDGHHDTLAIPLQAFYVFSPPLPDLLLFAGDTVPLHLFYVAENYERELLVNTYWHSATLLNLKRIQRWFPVIEPILSEYKIPDDFKYLCVIESNLSNTRSPAGATGFWQLMESTAKEYGLELNADIDERFHVEKSTRTACVYLRKAYGRYGNWALAAASYNAGLKRISDLLEQQKATSYFDLLMPEETERYLFRILALKTIAENPGAYGFKPDEGQSYEPLRFVEDTIRETIPDLAVYARTKGLSYKLLKTFNPWLRSNRVPVHAGKSYIIKIPLPPFSTTHRQYRPEPDTLKSH